MRELYIILSVVGWAWCLVAGAFLWVRLRDGAGAGRGKEAPADPGEGPAPPGPDGREEVRA